MKIRTGFVSNSSSSSFVMIFDKKPKTNQDVFDFLASTKNGKSKRYVGKNCDAYLQIAKDVLACKQSKKEKDEKIQEYLQNYYWIYCNKREREYFKKFFTVEQWKAIEPIIINIEETDEERYSVRAIGMQARWDFFCKNNNLPYSTYDYLEIKIDSELFSKWDNDLSGKEIYQTTVGKIKDLKYKERETNIEYLSILMFNYLKTNWKDKYIEIINYSDDYRSEIEHNDIWRETNTLIFSHH